MADGNNEIKQIQYLGKESLQFLANAISKNYVSHAELESVLAGLDFNGTSSSKGEFYKVLTEKIDASDIIAAGGLTNKSFNQGDFLYGLSETSKKYILYYYDNEWTEISRSSNEYTGGDIEINIATTEKAGIVKASDEISVDPLSGLMAVKAIPVGKIVGLDDHIKSITYTKEEINHFLLSNSAASEMKDIEVSTLAELNSASHLGDAVGTIAYVSETGENNGYYILEEDASGKHWKKLTTEKSLSERIEEIAEKAESPGSWETF